MDFMPLLNKNDIKCFYMRLPSQPNAVLHVDNFIFLVTL